MIRKFSTAALRGSVACLALICSESAWAQAKLIDIPAEDAGKSIPELARQAGIQIIAPGQALHGVVTPAVKGEYEVRVALTGMLKGTDLRIAADDGQTIVLAPNPKNVLAAADDAAAGSSAVTIEQVVVTGSRVISNIANSPTPLTVVSTEQLQATTPTNIPDALNKLPVFLGSQQPRSAGNGGSGSGQNVLALRNFGAQRTLVLFDSHRVAPDNANGTVNVDRPYGPGYWTLAGAGTAANPFAFVQNTRVPTHTFGGLITCAAPCTLNGQQFVANGVVGPFTHGAPTGTANVESGGDGAYDPFGQAITYFRPTDYRPAQPRR